MKRILLIAGPTASGKSSRAVEEALEGGGEVISVDSRQVYRGLNIGTEKITPEEMRGVPHHLIDIRDPAETYSAGDFLADASGLIRDLLQHGKLPVLAGGTHYYFDALLYGLPENIPENPRLREELAPYPTDELYARVASRDPRRASELDPRNRRRIVRALEIIEALGAVPPRAREGYPQLDAIASSCGYPLKAEWVVMDPGMEELEKRIEARLLQAFDRGLIAEVERVRGQVGDARLSELGLEYRVIGEYLRGERTRQSLLPALAAQLRQYARRQKAWLRKLKSARGA